LLERSLAPDHPAAQGHFPGNPIIPGAVLLSETLRAIESALGLPLSPCAIRAAKFPHPARPGERLRIEFSGHPGETIRFSCAVGVLAVLSGEVTCPATPARD
jgi:3-hydroxyacyl-[acyl-carrier-protein] dehydratase